VIEDQKTADDDIDIEAVYKQVEGLFAALEPDERAELFDVLLERFCPECGEEMLPDQEHECVGDLAGDDEDDEDDENDEEEGKK